MIPDSPRAAFALVAVVLMLATGLAGCVGGSSSQPDTGQNDVDDALNDTDVNDSLGENTTVKVRNGTQFSEDSTLHTHNYWQMWGTESIDIIDGTTKQVNWQQTYLSRPWGTGLDVIFDVPTAKNEFGLPTTVFAGTGKMEITLEWNSQASAAEGADGRIRPLLCVTNQGGVPPCGANQNVSWRPDSSGDTLTITKADDPQLLNPWTTDPPHSLKSNWRFGVSLSTSVAGGAGTQIPKAWVDQITLTVTIFRSEENLPVDPPHFAFYGDKQQLTIAEGSSPCGSQPPCTTAESVPWRQWASANWQFSETTDPWFTIGATDLKASDASDTPVVASRTKRLAFQLEWDNNDAPLSLRYRTAADGWTDAWKEPSQVSSCSGDLQNCQLYTIPVSVLEQDSPYAYNTQWIFGIFYDGGDPAPKSGFYWQYSITTFKDPTQNEVRA